MNGPQWTAVSRKELCQKWKGLFPYKNIMISEDTHGNVKGDMGQTFIKSYSRQAVNSLE